MNSIESLEHFKNTMCNTLNTFSNSLTQEYYTEALGLIQNSCANGGRVHVTGIGKPGHVAAYAASLLSSTGTPAYFLHGTEAVHGSCGQLKPGDVVICISNSGNTEELKATGIAIHRNGCKIIGVSGNARSWLASNSDVFLLATVTCEGGPLNRAPMASVLIECMVLQGLCVLLETQRGLTLEEYVLRHPGGTLGKIRLEEKC